MTRSTQSALGADFAPTPYADLNTVLRSWLEAISAELGDNLAGAWLTGSFAVGDFDDGSDCDFMVALERDLSPEQALRLEAIHLRIHDAGPLPWSQRLEGSYAPKALLKALTAEPRDPPGEPRDAHWTDPGMKGSPARVYPFWFLGHGHTDLVRSEHDNSQVVRWATREKGVTLLGPPPSEVIDPVSSDALRTEVRGQLRRLTAEWTAQPAKVDKEWLQGFFVQLYSRMLHTLATGEIRSKTAASDWAIANLEPRWRPLIERADAIRTKMPDERMGPADRQAVAETLAFMRYALRQDARMSEQRAKAERKGPGGGSPPPNRPGGPPRGFGGNQGARSHGGYRPPTNRPGGSRGRG